MHNDWLTPYYRIQLIKEEQSPRIVVSSFFGFPNHIRGTLLRFSVPTGATFLMIVSNVHSASASDFGKLLGLALIDSKTNVLLPTFMPFRMGTAFLREDGTFRP